MLRAFRITRYITHNHLIKGNCDIKKFPKQALLSADICLQHLPMPPPPVNSPPSRPLHSSAFVWGLFIIKYICNNSKYNSQTKTMRERHQLNPVETFLYKSPIGYFVPIQSKGFTGTSSLCHMPSSSFTSCLYTYK